MSRKSLVPIVLPIDPAQPLEAATKQYVDAVELWVQSRGTGLVTNGTALLGDNTNFSGFVYNGVESFAGGGSFTYDGPDAAKYADELIPVDVSRRYRFAYAIKLLSKSVPSETPNHYGWVAGYDIDRLAITAQHVMKVSGSALTTLAADLNPGATTITLTSATGWHNGATAHMRSIAMYPWTSAQGFVFPLYTYTRSVYMDSTNGMWLQNGISGNVITLRVPWAGPAFPAGTAVANAQSGGTYDYIAGANVATPTDWTIFEGTIGKWDRDAFYTSVDTTVANGMFMSPTGFRWGTAYAQVGWLLSYNTPAGTAKTAIDAVTFELAGSDVAQSAVQRAGDTMSGPLSITSGSLSMGSQIGQVINLYSTLYGIGIQSGTEYFRTAALSAGQFAWYAGGVHSATPLDPGAGGTLLMKLGGPANDLTLYRALTLPSDPVNALHASTKQYVDAQVGTRLTQAQVDARVPVVGDPLYVNVAGDTMTAPLLIGSSSGVPLQLNNTSAAGSQVMQVRSVNGQPNIEFWDSTQANRIGFVMGVQSGAGTQGLLITADTGGVVRTRVGATDVMTVGDSDVSTIRLRNAVPAADYWSAGSVFFVEGIGQVGSVGSWWMSIVANGYRNASNTWTTLNANGQVGAAEIDLTNTGIIIFRASPTHNNGATPQPPEQCRVIGNATALTGQFVVGKTAAGTQTTGTEMHGVGLLRVTRDTTAESIQLTRVGAGNAATSFFIGFRTGAADTMIGSIRANATNDGVTFNQTSHGPWKGDVADIDDDEALRLLNQWRPISYRWKRLDDGTLSSAGSPSGRTHHGFIAQELAEFAPDAVSPSSGEEGDEDFAPAGVDATLLVPTMVAAMQAMVRRIEALEARLAS